MPGDARLSLERESSAQNFDVLVLDAFSSDAVPVHLLTREAFALYLRHLRVGENLDAFVEENLSEGLDDVAIWGVLAVILMDWVRVGRQAGFLVVFAAVSWLFRRLMRRLPSPDRWYAALIWLLLCGWAADWSGLHFMVGAFLSGAVMDADWFDRREMDRFRHYVLLAFMPVFFLSTGLRTGWSLGGGAVVLAAAGLLIASVGGKLLGVHLAGRILGWPRGEAAIIGWLLQTKGLIMIVFVSVLLDRYLITEGTFTALLLMAVASTMLTVPLVAPRLARAHALIFRAA